MYLVDTAILSAAAPTKAGSSGFAELVAWMDAASSDLRLSAVSVAEIVAGIEELRLRGQASRAERLADWLAAVEHLYGERILPFDRAVARQAGLLTARAKMSGAAPGFADAAIAATASAHGMTVLTRNARHFRSLGVPFHDPYADGLPPLPGSAPV